MRLVVACLLAAGLLVAKEKLERLPAAVRATVLEQTKNATLVGVSKEKEKGKTMYEVETRVNGKARDLMVDEAGKVVSVEEEVEIGSIPAGARAAIEKRAAGGAVKRVEKLTMGAVVAYEGVLRVKGKTIELTVNGDGSIRQ